MENLTNLLFKGYIGIKDCEIFIAEIYDFSSDWLKLYDVSSFDAYSSKKYRRFYFLFFLNIRLVIRGNMTNKKQL